MGDDPGTLSRLKIRWWATALAAAALLAAVGAAMTGAFGTRHGLTWSAGAAVAAILPLYLLRTGLHLNRAANGTLLPDLGAANTLTVWRGMLVAVVAGCIPLPLSLFGQNRWMVWAAAGLFTLALLLDVADGRVARRGKRVTDLGRRLDTQIDALAVLVGSLLAVRWHKAHAGFAAVGLAYYLFCLGRGRRRRLALPVRDLDPSGLRRLLAAAMMTVIGTLLFPPIPPRFGHWLSAVAAVLFLSNFFRDWLFVCGVIGKRAATPIRVSEKSDSRTGR